MNRSVKTLKAISHFHTKNLVVDSSAPMLIRLIAAQHRRALVHRINAMLHMDNAMYRYAAVYELVHTSRNSTQGFVGDTIGDVRKEVDEWNKNADE